MRHSSILLTIVGGTLLSFSLAVAQQAATHETKPAKQNTHSIAMHARKGNKMAAAKTKGKTATAKSDTTAKKATKTAVGTKKTTAMKTTSKKTKGTTQSGKSAGVHKTKTKASTAASGSAHHVKDSTKKAHSQVQKKSKS